MRSPNRSVPTSEGGSTAQGCSPDDRAAARIAVAAGVGRPEPKRACADNAAAASCGPAARPTMSAIKAAYAPYARVRPARLWNPGGLVREPSPRSPAGFGPCGMVFGCDLFPFGIVLLPFGCIRASAVVPSDRAFRPSLPTVPSDFEHREASRGRVGHRRSSTAARDYDALEGAPHLAAVFPYRFFVA